MHKISQDTENYRDHAGRQHNVDSFQTVDVDRDIEVVVHYFNDGMGITVGIADPRLGGIAAINIGREDTLALVAHLNKLFPETGVGEG